MSRKIDVAKINQIISEFLKLETITDIQNMKNAVEAAARITTKFLARLLGIPLEESPEQKSRGVNDDLAVDWCIKQYQSEE